MRRLVHGPYHRESLAIWGQAGSSPGPVTQYDRVLFGKWSGTEVKIDGKDLLIMKESDIIGMVEHRAELK